MLPFLLSSAGGGRIQQTSLEVADVRNTEWAISIVPNVGFHTPRTAVTFLLRRIGRGGVIDRGSSFKNR